MRVLRFVFGLLCLAGATLLGGLLLAATVLPLVTDWSRVVLTSGSMAPTIVVGDVVLADSDIAHPVDPGTVLVFADPNRPDGLLTHRVVATLPDGSYRTQGDANPGPDSAALAPDQVVGQARVLIPVVGLPSAWAQQGHHERAVAALLLAAALLWGCRYGLRDAHDPWLTPRSAHRGPRSRVRRRRLLVGGGITTAMSLSLVLLALTTQSMAAFTAVSTNRGNQLAAAPDWLAPTGTSVVGKGSGGLTGSIPPGGVYYVYAQVSDDGNPPSGVDQVSADLRSLTAGTPAVDLTAGTYTVGGLSYNYRSSLLTAGSVPEGSYTYTSATTDRAGNSGPLVAAPVSIDGTRPVPVDVQPTNKTGGVVGRVESGDSITYRFSEPIDPISILSGWDGSPTAVVARWTDNGASDLLNIRTNDNTTALLLGTVDAKADHAKNVSFLSSQMTREGNAIRVTFGTPTGGGVRTVKELASMTWAAQSGPTDAAGNGLVAQTITQSGTRTQPNF